jgi:alanine dehydrogenase
MASGRLSDLVYLSRDDVRSLLPPVARQIDLVDETLAATAAGDVELPPKLGVYPRPDSLIHAMPCHLRGQELASVKWVSAYFGNAAFGLPSISGLIILNEAETGIPLAVLDAAEITAARTAAMTGYCIRKFAPEGWSRVGIVGYGEQGRFHAALVHAMNPDASITAYRPSGVNGDNGLPVEFTPTVRDAVRAADVVVTAAPMRSGKSPPISAEWVADNSLVLPIDFDASLAPDAVGGAPVFLVDDVEQFEVYRKKGFFREWRDPDGAISDGYAAGAAGPVVCCNLGVGSLDAAFAAEVVRDAEESSVGIRLPR